MAEREKKHSMIWILFAFGAALAWGFYGPMLHKGQTILGSPFKALLCVGAAYFLMGVLVPLIMLSMQGGIGEFKTGGTQFALIGGAPGALGAIFIIFAFRNGGLPNYVMPVVFAGAPVVNVLVTMAMHPPKDSPNPLLWVGMFMAAAGAGLTLYFKPQG